MEFAPAPDSTDYTLEIVYYQKIPPLAVNSTNHILDNHPDLYVYSSLSHSAPYLHSDERIGVWAGKYQQIIEQITKSDDKARFSGEAPTITFNAF